MGQQYSAGGIIARKVKGIMEILCITTKNNLLSLPKGHVNAGETFQKTAIRELREEVGLTNARIIQFLGVLHRHGTEPDGSRSWKHIRYFLMDGAGYTYDHEENYVWVELDVAIRLMSYHEERNFLTLHRARIVSCPSPYFSVLINDSEYDGYPWKSDQLSADTSFLGQAQPLVSDDSVVVIAGIPMKDEIKAMSVASSVLVIPPPGYNITESGEEDWLDDHIRIAPRTLENVLDHDLPDNVSLFYARLSLNFSDTKTFFLLNQVRKKMRIGGVFCIEGRGERDGVIRRSVSYGPNLVRVDGKLLRVWTFEYVQNILVNKLNLQLIFHKERLLNQGSEYLISNQFVLRKLDAQGY
ncbi:MAG: NUDIX domain-containing protein [bacterium]